jgi:hypothetical protein
MNAIAAYAGQGLSQRRKLAANHATLTLLDLQLASTKYYFTVHRLQVLLDTFAG